MRKSGIKDRLFNAVPHGVAGHVEPQVLRVPRQGELEAVVTSKLDQGLHLVFLDEVGAAERIRDRWLLTRLNLIGRSPRVSYALMQSRARTLFLALAKLSPRFHQFFEMVS